jgi:hypothetical protein
VEEQQLLNTAAAAEGPSVREARLPRAGGGRVLALGVLAVVTKSDAPRASPGPEIQPASGRNLLSERGLVVA